jgi:uncharacterized Zn finger protein (UPF0148 family)
MASYLSLGATMLPVPCPNCGGTMLVHDGTTAEITCQLCSRIWECEPNEPGHEACTHFYSISPSPAFPHRVTEESRTAIR